MIIGGWKGANFTAKYRGFQAATIRYPDPLSSGKSGGKAHYNWIYRFDALLKKGCGAHHVGGG
jgi:hypothetical protein